MSREERAEGADRPDLHGVGERRRLLASLAHSGQVGVVQPEVTLQVLLGRRAEEPPIRGIHLFVGGELDRQGVDPSVPLGRPEPVGGPRGRRRSLPVRWPRR